MEGIALMTVFVLFFVELMAMRFATFGGDHETHSNGHNLSSIAPRTHENTGSPTRTHGSVSSAHTPGTDHLGHTREHDEYQSDVEQYKPRLIEDYPAQITAIFILEFGVVFHSIFVGLTLAVAGEEFKTLYVVLVFHQTFEGLGLGSRLAVTPWPKNRLWTPYLLAAAYGLSTPIAIAVGLGLRTTYAPGSQTALIVNGVFDSISAGILIYTGLVELMAHEFMFSQFMRRAPIGTVLGAVGWMCLGAGESSPFFHVHFRSWSSCTNDMQ